jgi:hypothetical protein
MPRDNAVIFVPPTLSLDGLYTRECISYVLGRGYQLAAIIRDWGQIDRMLQAGRAGVVVVAREEHRAGAPDSDPSVTASLELPNAMPEDRVRRILDGDEPVPCGVAPETVAALRMIWWRLRDLP